MCFKQDPYLGYITFGIMLLPGKAFKKWLLESLVWRLTLRVTIPFMIFLLHLHDNQSKLLAYQEWVKFLMITLVSSQKSPNPNISAPSVCSSLVNVVPLPF